MKAAANSILQTMVKNLVGRGAAANALTLPVHVHNRSVARAETLASSLTSGATKIKRSLADAADSIADVNIVFLCLADDAAVSSTIGTLVAHHALGGKLIVDCSTVSPDTARKSAETVLGAGGRFVHMPVFGAPAAADAGALVCCPCGARGDVEKLLPLLKDVVGRAVVDLSFEDGATNPDYGRAAILKLIGNTFIFNMVAQLGEGFVVAEKTGLGPEKVAEVLALIYPGSPYGAYGQRMLGGDYWKRDEPLFAVGLARKDIRLAREVADGVGVRLRNAETVDEYLVQVEKHKKGAKGDVAGIYGAAREQAGLPFENGA